VSVLGPDGKPLNVERLVVDELPSWCRGVSYRADDDVITVLVHVPASSLAHEHLLRMECEASHARALIDALQQCVTRSEDSSKVLDVPAGPVS
jgi:hypothetical protein